MHIHLLGYSEAAISRILDTLAIKNYSGKIMIVQNIKVEESIPFCPPGISYEKIYWNEWTFNRREDSCMPALVTPSVKKTVVDFFHQHCGITREDYTSLHHPSAVIASTVSMGKGCFTEPGAVIASFADIRFGVNINRGCTIGHHVVIEDFVSIGPGSHIAGYSSIGEGTHIGIGTVVFDRITIGSNSIIGGGSVVTKNIPPGVIAWGNPCKIIKPNAAI
jgi:sugar O-acyltransferase (sialic acid O-acetyltransferase NeuD family)